MDDKYQKDTTDTTGSFEDYKNSSLEGYVLSKEEVDRGDSTSANATGAYTGVKATDNNYEDKVIYIPEVVKKGNVVIKYVNEAGETIKEDYEDTKESPVGTDYNTGENETEKPKIIEKDGKKYIFTKIKDVIKKQVRL
ncbi:MucBP domain-containing protein [Gemella sp. GH3]|nr:MucBP domain-containing protein [Gemella sp. GH3.1]NYS51187.1 MucBP domain-containing protein [Gemella sp. GH3]